MVTCFKCLINCNLLHPHWINYEYISIKYIFLWPQTVLKWCTFLCSKLPVWLTGFGLISLCLDQLWVLSDHSCESSRRDSILQAWGGAALQSLGAERPAAPVLSMELFATEAYEKRAVGPCVITAYDRVYVQVSVIGGVCFLSGVSWRSERVIAQRWSP